MSTYPARRPRDGAWHAPLARGLLWIGVFAQAANLGDWVTTLVGVGFYRRPEHGQVVLQAIHAYGLIAGVTVVMAAWAVGFGLAIRAGRRWVATGSLPATILILSVYFGTLKSAVVLANIVAILSAR